MPQLRWLLPLVLVAGFATPTHAALVEEYFDFTSSGIIGQVVNGDDLAFTLSIDAGNGVMFDAIVTVAGSSFGNPTVGPQTSQGIDTGNVDGMQIFDTLALSVAVTNVTGGDVTINGFISAALNNDPGTDNTAFFSTAPGLGIQAIGANTTPQFMFTSPTLAFSVSGATLEDPGFYLEGVTVSFTAVPEPASLAMMGMAGLAFAGIGYRRYRRRNRSAASPLDLSLVS